MSIFGDSFRFPADAAAIVGADPGQELSQDDKDAIEAAASDRDRAVEDAAAARRIGVTLTSNQPQAIPNNTVLNPSTWPTVVYDSHHFYPANTGDIVIPKGMGGLYIATFSGTDDVSPDAGFGSSCGFLMAGVEYKGVFATKGTGFAATATAIRPLLEGDTVRTFVWQATGGGMNFDPSRLDLFRILP